MKTSNTPTPNNLICLAILEANQQDVADAIREFHSRTGARIDCINAIGSNFRPITRANSREAGFYYSILQYEFALLLDGACATTRDFDISELITGIADGDFAGPLTFEGYNQPTSTKELGAFGIIPSIRRTHAFYKAYRILEMQSKSLRYSLRDKPVPGEDGHPEEKIMIRSKENPSFSEIASARQSWPEELEIQGMASLRTPLIRISNHKTSALFSDQLPHIQYEKYKCLPIIARKANEDFANWLQGMVMPMAPPNNIIIISTPHAGYLANCLQDHLGTHGLNPTTLILEPGANCRDAVEDKVSQLEIEDYRLIIISPNAFKGVPAKHITFQLEQIHCDRWLTTEYIQSLRESSFIIDYSISNIEIIQDKLAIPPKKLSYLPIPQRVDQKIHLIQKLGHADRDIDLLFYGDIYCERRQKALNLLASLCNCKFVCGIFGDELNELISRSKVILNIHYYENAQLETVRLKEALSKGCVVVSEDALDRTRYFSSGHNEPVTFFPEGSFEECAEACIKLIRNRELWDQRQRIVLEHIREEYDESSMWMDRCFAAIGLKGLESLLAGTNLMSDLRIKSAEENHFKPNSGALGQTLVLSIPETPKRLLKFKEQNSLDNWWVFPGAKFPIGWIGCGLSYWLVLSRLQNSRFKYLEIIEDDALLPANHAETRSVILNYLETRENDWDVFCGLVTDVSDDLLITESTEYNGQKFIFFRGMTGMVANIYKSTSCRFIKDWHPTSANVHTFSIDRHLENQRMLKCVTILPYHANLINDSISTLWGNNTTNLEHYSELIRLSELAMFAKVRKFEQNRINSFSQGRSEA